MSSQPTMNSPNVLPVSWQAIDWPRVTDELNDHGHVLLPEVLSASTCDELSALYDEDERFRSTITMSRYHFGQGEYRYFKYPLPSVIETLRRHFYARLAPIANAWHRALKSSVEFPSVHEDFLQRCHVAGQTRPTPLLLKYGSGDYNCLHQDLYGEHVFPLQVAVLLSQPQRDFTGGEFVLTEQRPRMQSRATVVPLQQGDGVVFAVRERPVDGRRGVYRVNMRHGVSRIRSGHRHTLGVIFHDAL